MCTITILPADPVRRAVPIAVSGDFDDGDRAALQQAVASLAADADEVIIDLSAVTFFGAAGAGALVACRRLCEVAGTLLSLRFPSRCVARTLDITGLAATLGLASMTSADPFPVEQGKVIREESAEHRRAAGAEHLLIGHLRAHAVIDARDVATLHEALATARRIGAAVGYVMAVEQVGDAQAFQLLRRASQGTDRKLRDIAEDVLAGPGRTTEPAGGPAPGDGAPEQVDVMPAALVDSASPPEP